MPHYRSVGDVPRKRHTQFRDPDGRLYAEELMGVEGFSAESALLYHRRSPTAITAAEVARDIPAGPAARAAARVPARGDAPDAPAEPASVTAVSANLPLLPRHLRAHALPAGGDVVTGARLLLANTDVALSYVAATEDSPLVRDATGDTLLYVESGSGALESVFGALPVGAGDYVVVPTATTHRWTVTDGPLRALVVHARGHVRPPARYLSAAGQFLEHSPYCERDLRAPEQPLLADDTGPVRVLVRTRSGDTWHTHPAHPFDVVGWDGGLYPFALSIHDFEPVTGRVHQPPPVHQTFDGPGFVVCSFVPRLFDYHPQAVPVPYHHANVDSDEVLFYVGGNFMSRAGSGIGAGSLSVHPAGFVHGPQPGSVERALGKADTDELAVMVDTFAPLGWTAEARSVEAPDYPWTWAQPAAGP